MQDNKAYIKINDNYWVADWVISKHFNPTGATMAAMSQDYIVAKETENAVLFTSENFHIRLWAPKSQLKKAEA